MVKLVKYIYTTYGYLYALNLIMGYRNPTGTISRDQFANLLHKDKEHLPLRNNFKVTKKFLITKFDCTLYGKKNKIFVRFLEELGTR